MVSEKKYCLHAFQQMSADILRTPQLLVSGYNHSGPIADLSSCVVAYLPKARANARGKRLRAQATTCLIKHPLENIQDATDRHSLIFIE